MSRSMVNSPDLATPSGHFSQAIAVQDPGQLLFISGMTARRSDGSVVGVGDVASQTRQVCENLRTVVETAGGTLADLVRVDVFVRNIEHFDEVHAVRRLYFPDPPPASTMLEVSKMVHPDMLIEINAIAVLT